MDIVSGIAIYIIIWAVILFTVLPIGVTSMHESQEPVENGIDPGAPSNPNLVKKFALTSVLALIVFAGVYGLFYTGLFNRFLYWLFPL